MKLVSEKINKENYCHILLTRQEKKSLDEFFVLSAPCQINGQTINVDLRISLKEEGYDDEI
ncbi:hypothetical protein HC928_02495 [bacterium]|nr:hypothetical protein [bacterium]